MCDVMQSDVAPVYDLFAVLIHRGQSASSGHYIALIKDPVTGITYKFNDTEVEKEKKLSLANEEDTGCDAVLSGQFLYPLDAALAWYMLRLCLSLCMSQASIVSKRLNGSCWFLAHCLPLAYRALY